MNSTGQEQSEQNSFPPPCKAGCGFFSNASLGGYCSKCHKEFSELEDSTVASTPAASTAPAPASPEACEPAQPAPAPVEQLAEPSPAPSEPHAATPEAPCPEVASARPAQKNRSRCYTCKKKVGLTGFECKCEYVFCGSCRYPEKHSCSFDHKAEGRERLATQNERIVADKIARF
ncbi:unnamed protein product [Pedinophyceae sp. YPF-701]|nr:unnamed protein product [Pedinophyceae sp. YPF-701]